MYPVLVGGGSDRSVRHPLEVGLHRRGPAGAVVALVGLVVAGATGPGVVGDLVVIDGGDERVALVQGAQVGVGLVEGVAPSVVLEGHDLVARVVASTDVAPGAEAALVEVVAEVDDQVEVVALGPVPVGRGVPVLVVAARHDPHPQPVYGRAGGGGGAGAQMGRASCREQVWPDGSHP